MDGQGAQEESDGGSTPHRVARRPGRRSDGERSHRAIMEAATVLATERGLDGLSIGDLAAATGMSKGGLYAHFGSKESLQLAIIAEAADVLETQVIQPALREADPLARLRALCEAFLNYAEHTYPGGCFFSAVSSEFATRSGVVRDRLVEHHSAWMRLLTALVDDAHTAGRLNLLDKQPALLAFELESLLHLANDSYILHQDSEQLDYARKSLAWLLGRHAA